jgi:diamine N-acetyltransferase
VIDLFESCKNDISKFVELESSPEASKFVIQYSADKHAEEMGKENIKYLNIFHQSKFAGFAILATEHRITEFRRIIINSKCRGIGQKSILAIESYCKNICKPQKIWLDVFEENNRAKHIYKKLGYNKFKSELYDGRILEFFQKNI